MEKYETLEQVKNKFAVVHQVLEYGGSLEDCLVLLANANHNLLKRLTFLSSIAPRKIKLDDGRVFIWRCPDEMIPEDPFGLSYERKPDASVDQTVDHEQNSGSPILDMNWTEYLKHKVLQR